MSVLQPESLSKREESASAGENNGGSAAALSSSLSTSSTANSSPRAAAQDNSLSSSNTVPTSNATEKPVAVSVDPARSRYRWIALALIFLTSVLLLITVYSTFPKLDAEERAKIKLPRNIEDAKVLGGILSRYKDRYYWNVLGGLMIVYIFLQTFAIPGSIFLSILSGYLFSFWLALLVVCFCSACGASFCYGLSWLVGRRLIYKYFPERVESWSVTVNRHRDSLLNYIVFLRVTPFLPNWFINLTSPVLGVPIAPFFFGTFIGVAPPSFVAIQAGTTLNMLTSSSDAVSWTSLLLLVVLGGLSLIPVLLKHRLREKFDKAD